MHALILRLAIIIAITVLVLVTHVSSSSSPSSSASNNEHVTITPTIAAAVGGGIIGDAAAAVAAAGRVCYQPTGATSYITPTNAPLYALCTNFTGDLILDMSITDNDITYLSNIMYITGKLQNGFTNYQITKFAMPQLISVTVIDINWLYSVASISFPNLRWCNGLHFKELISVSSISLPLLSSITAAPWATRTDESGANGEFFVLKLLELTMISLPSLTTIDQILVQSLPALRTIDLPRVKAIDTVTIETSGIVHIDSWINIADITSISIYNLPRLISLNGLFRLRRLQEILLWNAPLLSSLSPLCSLQGGATGAITLPGVSCRSLDMIFASLRPQPRVTSCDPSLPPEGHICDCVSLESVGSLLCPTNYVCGSITPGNYTCRYGQCQALPVSGNYTIRVTHNNMYPAVAIYECLPGYYAASGVASLNRTCQLDGTWTPSEPRCIDINECESLPSPCAATSVCFNMIGSYYCSPFVVTGSLRGVNGHYQQQHGSVELLDNHGGQQVSVTISNCSRLFSYELIWFSNVYADFSCTDTIITPTVLPIPPNATYSVTLVCTIPAGAGRGYQPVLYTCMAMDRCLITPVPYRTDFLHYPLFIIDPGSFRLDGEPSSMGRTELLAPSNEPFILAFDIATLVPLPYPPLQFKQPWLLTYGPSYKRDQYECTLQAINGTTVTCMTQQGYGTALRVTIHHHDRFQMDSYTLVSDDYITYPGSSSPGIARLTPGSCATTEHGCSTRGLSWINIEATSAVTPPVQVMIGGVPCTKVQVVGDEHHTLMCSLPPGTGLVTVAILMLDSSAGVASRVIQYSAPSITSLSSTACGNKDALTLFNCTRTGNITVTVNGQNFGASGATVFIGTKPCIATRHSTVPTRQHEKLTCTLPPGVGNDYSVLVLQDGGSISTTATRLSYRPCAAGYETDPTVTVSTTNAACRPCQNGTYSTDGITCLPCDARSEQPLMGQPYCRACIRPLVADDTRTKCRLCPAGEQSTVDGPLVCIACTQGWHSNHGSGICNPCPTGSFTASSRSDSCIACPPGSFQALGGQTYCSSCAAGSYSSMASSSCSLCGVGKATSEPGSIVCRACTSGTISPIPGGTQCQSCPQGTIANDNHTSCIPCAAGLYGTNGASCEACALGRYSTAGASQCSPCGTSYSLDASVDHCLPCTSGLSCRNGIAVVKQNYWSWIVTTSSGSSNNDTTPQVVSELRTAPCSYGRCHREHDTDICAPHRNQSATNILCASCEDGYAEWGPASSCIACTEPNGGYIVLIVFVSFVLVLILHYLAQNATGIGMVFFYFVQLSLLMAPPASYVLAWLSFLNLAPTNTGICIAPLTPHQQIMLSVLSPIWLFVQLLLVMSTQGLLSWCQCGQRITHRYCWSWRSYVRTAVDIYMFSYSAVATILVSVLRCITVVDDKSFIFDYPAISCDDDNYKSWSIAAIFMLIIFVILPPLIALLLLYRHRRHLSSPHIRSRWGTLFEMFTPKAFYWQTLVVLRRVAFIAINMSIIALPSLRYFLFALLHVLTLVGHLLVRPYRDATLNTLEHMTLSTLAILAMLLTAFPSADTIDDTTGDYNNTAIQLSITFLIITPVIIMVVYAVRQILRKPRPKPLPAIVAVYGNVSNDRDDDHDNDNGDRRGHPNVDLLDGINSVPSSRSSSHHQYHALQQ